MTDINDKFWAQIQQDFGLDSEMVSLWKKHESTPQAPAKKVRLAKKDKVKFTSRKGNVKTGTIVKIGVTTKKQMVAMVLLDDEKKAVPVLLKDLEKVV